MTRIVFIANTVVGKRGSIGLRYGYVINKLLEHNEVVVIARGSHIKHKNLKIRSSLILLVVQTVLNQIRLLLLPKFNSKIFDLLLFKYYVRFSLRTVDIRSYDVVLINEYLPDVIRKLQAKGLKVMVDVPIAPTITRMDLSDVFDQVVNSYTASSWMEREISSLQLADRVLVPSVYVREQILRYPVREDVLRVVPFGCDIEQWRTTEGFLEYFNGVTIMFAGVLNKRKGIEYLLQAWDSIDTKNARLVLLGRHTKWFNAEIKKYDFRNVLAVGHVEVHKYLSHADLYVLPSLMEGSSKSIYEAMSHGLPIICTKETGSICVNNKNAFIINSRDSVALAEAMKKLINGPLLRQEFSKNSLEMIKEYTWEKYANNVILNIKEC